MQLSVSTKAPPASQRQLRGKTRERPREQEYDLLLLAALSHLAQPPHTDDKRALRPSRRRLSGGVRGRQSAWAAPPTTFP